MSLRALLSPYLHGKLSRSMKPLSEITKFLSFSGYTSLESDREIAPLTEFETGPVIELLRRWLPPWTALA